VLNKIVFVVKDEIGKVTAFVQVTNPSLFAMEFFVKVKMMEQVHHS